MIDTLFLNQDVREKYRCSPMLPEREQYLAHLANRGISIPRMRAVANLLFHIVRLMELSTPRPVDMQQVVQAGLRWAADGDFHSGRTPQDKTARHFRQVAIRWLTFHRMLLVSPQPAPPFQELMTQFLHAMKAERGLSPETLRGYGSRTSYFLQWLALRYSDLSKVSVADTDEFIEAKRLAGWGPRSLATQCQAMRTFFGYAESQGWCVIGIRRSIKSPRIPK